MGISLMGSVSSSCATKNEYKGAPNPNPFNYIMQRYAVSELGILVEVKYPDCTTFEGNKIILYRGNNLSIDQLKREKSLDPHFQKGLKIFKPFARLEPTEDGWLCGLRLLGLI